MRNTGLSNAENYTWKAEQEFLSLRPANPRDRDHENEIVLEQNDQVVHWIAKMAGLALAHVQQRPGSLSEAFCKAVRGTSDSTKFPSISGIF